MTATIAAAAAAAAAASSKGPHNNNKKRLVLTLYRSLMRWCQDVPPFIPLDEFIPAIRGETMDDVDVFRQAIRESFREEKTDVALSDRIGEGLRGLRQLNEIKPSVLAYARQWGDSIRRRKQQQQQLEKEKTTTTTAASLDEHDWIQEQLKAIEWLPKIEDCSPRSLDFEEDDDNGLIRFPLFPLQSTLFHSDVIAPPSSGSDDDNNNKSINYEIVPLPLFTSQSEIPVPGSEVPLKIFEPRYRQLYSDLREKSPPRRHVIMPFVHPMIPGQFARMALVHQLTHIREVADETSGQIQYLVDHVVTKPICIQQILNPQVWATKETYLQVEAKVLEENWDVETADLVPLQKVLQDWKNETSNPLATKCLAVLQGEGFWPLVHTWMTHMQQELIQLQLGVATQVKRQAGMKNDTFTVVANQQPPTQVVTPEIVALAQEPHRRRLLQLMLDNTSLLVPTLLSLDGLGKCRHLMELMLREQQRSK